MTSDKNDSPDTPDSERDGADVQRRVDEVEGSLWDGIGNDSRIESGVPDEHRSSDVDFIRMSGLTRPKGPEEPSALRVPPPEDLDPSRPVSFFEKGVADVDASMEPSSLEMGAEPDQEYGVEVPSASIAGLKDIIADLTTDHAEAPPAATRTSTPSTSEAWSFPGADEPSDLLEAEQLLQALQEQPRDDYLITGPATPTPEPAPVESAAATPFVTVPGASSFENTAALDAGNSEKGGGEPEQEGDEEYERDSSPYRRRSKSRKRRMRRQAIRWGIRLAALFLLAIGGLWLYWWIEPRLLAPEKSFMGAETLLAQGKYSEASNAYLTFAKLHPDHRERPFAQFNAGYVLLLQKTPTHDDSVRVAEDALKLFKAFVDANPNHAKAFRAQVLMGMLEFRLGDYQKAIELLRQPDLRMRDADAALPALRLMARAYTQLGEYDAAVSMYEQAGTLPGNYNADVDYNELGDLYQRRADAEQDEEKKVDLQKSTLKNWLYAMRLLGIDPVNRDRIKEKYDYLLSQMPESAKEGLQLDKPADVIRGTETQRPEEMPEPQINSAPVGKADDAVTSPDPAQEAAFLSAPLGGGTQPAAAPSAPAAEPIAAEPEEHKIESAQDAPE